MQKSILLCSYLYVSPERALPCASLVDSGCTGEAFLDHSFAVKNHIPLLMLPFPRPLHLADGGLKSWIRQYTILPFQVGDHVEELSFFVTDLAAEHPVILGTPWLARHNPDIDWTTMSLTFSRCGNDCFPNGRSQLLRAAPTIQKPSGNYKPPSVEDEPDGNLNLPAGEDDDDVLLQEVETPAESVTVHADDRSLNYWDQWRVTWERNRKRTERRRLRRLTQRAIRRQPAAPVDPAKLRQPTVKMSSGTRIVRKSRPEARHRILDASIRNTAEADTPDLPVDGQNIRLLNAPNFMFLTRQKGVRVMRTTMAELEKASQSRKNIRIPRLSEDMFKQLLAGQGRIERWKNLLPEECHDFIDYCYNSPVSLRKISDEDAQKFFDKADRAPLTPEEIKARIPEYYHDLLHVALPQEADVLPPHRSYDHKIEVIPGNQLPYSKSRPMSPTELRVVKRWLDDNLAKGFIRPSTSDVASPVLLAKKPGGGVRICVDYRGINNITLKNRYPLPLIRETLDAIANAKIFTKLDVIAAFNRVRVSEGYEWLTAFITRFGLYESLVTPFGLTGAPATFQHFVNDLLYDILDDYVTAYLDDILIYSKNEKDHIEHVREVMKRLEKAGLQIDLHKCEFHTKKTKYLGLIITPGGIEMDPEKVRAVVDWLPPTTKRQLQRFLGFANFYRRFIRGFSALAKPLHDLTKKTAAFTWTESCQTAFEQLKVSFTTAPTLRIFDWNRPAVVEVDASNWSAGGTLSQCGDDGELYPVAYFSAKHSAQECNYDIYDKELLAVIKALEEWRPELEGSREPFDIITDHKNLQTFATTKQLSPRHMRWSEFLARFNFRITYRPGTLNTRPDALSRKPEDVPANESDDRLRARRKPLIDSSKFDPEMLSAARLDSTYWNTLFNSAAGSDESLQLFEIDISRPLDDLIDETYAKSALLRHMYEALQNPEARKWPKELKKELKIPFAECAAKAGRVYYRDRLVIDPLDAEVQIQIIHRTHTAAPGGHPGRVKTIDLLNRKYWWPGMTVAARAYCKGCLLCTKTKTPRTAPVGFLKPLPLPFAPWKDISVDYITPLPPCEYRGRTFKHVAVVVDRLTKMRHFIPTETLETEELGDYFIDRIYSTHGCPDTIISDRGAQFVSTLWRTLSARLGITLRPSSAFHPQTNGQTERVNAELEQFLRLYVNWAQDDWARWLPLAEFAGNNAVSETTGVSPFFANYGFNPRMGVEPASPPNPKLTEAQRREFFKATEITARFKAVLDHVTALSRQSQDRYEANANRSRVDSHKYKENDLVMLDTRNLKTGRPTEKLAPRWEGPFKVHKASSHAVTLKLPENMKVNPTFHVSLVRPWRNEGIAGQERAEGEVRANQGRVMVRTDDHHEAVEWPFNRILDYGKADNGRWQYLVDWIGHDPTWQPVADLKGCDDALWEYHNANPSLPPPHWLKKPEKPKATPERTTTTPRNAAGAAPAAPPRRSPRAAVLSKLAELD